MCFQVNNMKFFISLNGKTSPAQSNKNSTGRILDANNITA